MDNFESKNIHPITNQKFKAYLRFIDDIFMLWTETLDVLKKIKHVINQIHPLIKLTFEYSFKEINFLDTTIIISPNGRLTTKVFKNLPTDQATYIIPP